MTFDRSGYIRTCEAQIERIRESLEPLESGRMRIGGKLGDGPWEDKTQDWIARHKENIATYEKIIAALKKGEVP